VAFNIKVVFVIPEIGDMVILRLWVSIFSDTSTMQSSLAVERERRWSITCFAPLGSCLTDLLSR